MYYESKHVMFIPGMVMVLYSIITYSTSKIFVTTYQSIKYSSRVHNDVHYYTVYLYNFTHGVLLFLMLILITVLGLENRCENLNKPNKQY